MINFWRFQSISEQQYTLLEGSYNFYLVTLSIVIAGMAAYSSLIVIERMWHSNSPHAVKLWKLFGGIVFGIGVWAMHFTGMLAFTIHGDMSYNLTLTIASLIPPIIGANFAFQILYRKALTFVEMQLSALYLALGIGSMHFMGMEAMQMDSIMVYDLSWFIASLVIAHLFACIAIYLMKFERRFYKGETYKRLITACVMGLSVSGMHYTAMNSVSFYISRTNALHGSHSGSFYLLALTVAFFVLLIVSATILCSIVDARLQSANSTVQATLSREQDIVNNLADGLIIIDEIGVVNSINYKGIEMFEYQHSTLDTLNIQVLMPEFELKSLTEKALIEGSLRSIVTINGVKKSGAIFPVEVNLSRMSTLNNDKRLFNCVVRDISQRVELETRLLQAQKMESIGQLAAGIAHEINTPAQYVSDNAEFLREAFQTYSSIFDEIKAVIDHSPALTQHSVSTQRSVSTQPPLSTINPDPLKNSGDSEVSAYLQALCTQEVASEQEVINEKAEAIHQPHIDYQKVISDIFSRHDLTFISQEIPLALNQSLEGLQRINHIVGAMKSFSHTNNDEVQFVDINEAIESTITIARGEWRYVARVETNFDNQLTNIPCYRDQFNQVILNFIINASHAIEEKHQSNNELGLISISTVAEEHWAVIRIEDNGIGMPKKIVDRIFDPFFTTKEVGKGTGQGLSIAYSIIVDLHEGQIKTESTLNKGTLFTVKLPLSSKANPLDLGEIDENLAG